MCSVGALLLLRQSFIMEHKALHVTQTHTGHTCRTMRFHPLSTFPLVSLQPPPLLQCSPVKYQNCDGLPASWLMDLTGPASGWQRVEGGIFYRSDGQVHQGGSARQKKGNLSAFFSSSLSSLSSLSDRDRTRQPLVLISLLADF